MNKNNYLVPPDRNVKGFSKLWVNWQSKLSIKTCLHCYQMHGKILPMYFINYKSLFDIPAHVCCECEYVPMRTIKVGYVTEEGLNGADVFLYYLKNLPSYYITKELAGNAGWKPQNGNLDEVLSGKSIGGNIFSNKFGKLPDDGVRIWYEADFDYEGGYRNNKRLLYSSDGLMFVTYDHYQTFYEVVL